MLVPRYAPWVEQRHTQAIEHRARGAWRLWGVICVSMLCWPLSCVLLSDFGGLTGDGKSVWDSGAPPDGALDGPQDGSHDAFDDVDADVSEKDAPVSTPGIPVLVAAVQGHVWALLADGDDIFWTVDEVVLGDGGLGSAVYKASQGCQGASCGTVLAFAADSTRLTDIAADFEWLYYGEIDSGRIMRVRRQSGEIETLAVGQANPLGLALSASHVYWTGYDTAALGYLRRAPKSPLAPDAGAAAAVPMLEQLAQPQFLAADPFGSKLFWGTDTGSKIQSCFPTVGDGGAPTCNVKTLSAGTLKDPGTGAAQLRKLVADSTHVYWREGWKSPTAWTVGAVRRVDKNGNVVPDGGAPSQLLAEGAVAYHPRWISLDQTHVYWTVADSGKVYRTTKQPGGAIEVVNSIDIPGVHSVVAVDGAVFASSWVTGEVYRIAL